MIAAPDRDAVRSAEPGPFGDDPWPFPPLTGYEPHFESYAADYLAARGGADGQLVALQADVLKDGIPDAYQAYEDSARSGENYHYTEAGAHYQSPAPELLDAGDETNGVRDEVGSYLPPPDASLDPVTDDPPGDVPTRNETDGYFGAFRGHVLDAADTQTQHRIVPIDRRVRALEDRIGPPPRRRHRNRRRKHRHHRRPSSTT